MSLNHYFLNEYSVPIDRFFEEMFSTRANRQGQQLNVFHPRMDIRHDGKANTVTATFDLPGLRKEDVMIDVHNNTLNVSGETKESTQRDEEGYAVRERRYGKFTRSLPLPQGTKNEDIKAAMADGVLDVTFPRSAPETAPSKITIA